MSRDLDSSLNSKKRKVAGCDIRKKRKWAKRIIEKLREGPAHPQDFINMGIPERSVYQTLKALKEEKSIDQKGKKGEYFLPGYENGPPERGRERVTETVIDEKNLGMYLCWGWTFKGNLDNKIIVRYERALQPTYT